MKNNELSDLRGLLLRTVNEARKAGKQQIEEATLKSVREVSNACETYIDILAANANVQSAGINTVPSDTQASNRKDYLIWRAAESRDYQTVLQGIEDTILLGGIREYESSKNELEKTPLTVQDLKLIHCLCSGVLFLLERENSEEECTPQQNDAPHDLISRKEAYNTLSEYYHHSTETQHAALKEALDKVPPISGAEDLVSVIRCRNCEYFGDYVNGSYCTRPYFKQGAGGFRTTGNGFCDKAERKASRRQFKEGFFQKRRPEAKFEKDRSTEEEKMSDSINRQEAIAAAKAVCLKIIDECKSHFDPEIGDVVYSDTLEVNAVLKCNKYICKALKELPPSKGLKD